MQSKYRDINNYCHIVQHYLQRFDYSFEQRPGKNHANADTMSRLPATGCVLVVFQQLVADASVIKAALLCLHWLLP